jgi:hypothetical protein
VLYGLRGGGREASPPLDRRLGTGERCAWTGVYALMALILSGLFFMMRHPAPTASLTVPLGGAAIAVLRGLAVALVGVTAALRFRLHTDPAPGFVRDDT